ncbi:hypothetical protein [Mesorhizobium sp.]|nr:hypothetical protein [Mesorhizobium sp.]
MPAIAEEIANAQYPCGSITPELKRIEAITVRVRYEFGGWF